MKWDDENNSLSDLDKKSENNNFLRTLALGSTMLITLLLIEMGVLLREDNIWYWGFTIVGIIIMIIFWGREVFRRED